jgi:hypothetical protein
MTECKARRTDYQPTDEKFAVCPVCGVDGENGPYTSFRSKYSDDYCLMLHVGDEVSCNACATTWTGTNFSEEIQEVGKAIDLHLVFSKSVSLTDEQIEEIKRITGAKEVRV